MSQWIIVRDGLTISGPHSDRAEADRLCALTGGDVVDWSRTAETYETLAPIVAEAEAQNEETIRQVTQAGADGEPAQAPTAQSSRARRSTTDGDVGACDDSGTTDTPVA